jgi:O-methyltransferase
VNQHHLSQWVVGMGSALKLGRTSKFVFKHAPPGVQQWADHCRSRVLGWHCTNILEAGHELISQSALERSYRESLLLLAGRYGGDAIGDYLEFGVCKGTSMACMFRALRGLHLENVRMFGFDSFEGLPEGAQTEDGGAWVPGEFRYDVERTTAFLDDEGADWNRVALVKGWFSDTLNDELIRRHGLVKASLIMIDCDLYSSAKAALDFCAPLIRDGAVIFFDDWHSQNLDERNLGEKRAFDEFLSAHHQFVAERLDSYSASSEIFFVRRVGDGRESR